MKKIGRREWDFYCCIRFISRQIKIKLIIINHSTQKMKALIILCLIAACFAHGHRRDHKYNYVEHFDHAHDYHSENGRHEADDRLARWGGHIWFVSADSDLEGKHHPWLASPNGEEILGDNFEDDIYPLYDVVDNVLTTSGEGSGDVVTDTINTISDVMTNSCKFLGLCSGDSDSGATTNEDETEEEEDQNDEEIIPFLAI